MPAHGNVLCVFGIADSFLPERVPGGGRAAHGGGSWFSLGRWVGGLGENRCL